MKKTNDKNGALKRGIQNVADVVAGGGGLFQSVNSNVWLEQALDLSIPTN